MTGWLLPLSRSGANGSAITTPRTSSQVCGPITISPGAAACSSRAARFTASPVASRSSVPVTTCPVFIPVRTLTVAANPASSS